MCIRDRLLAGPRARLGLADLHALADWSADLARAQAGAEEVRAERSIVDALDELPRPGWVSRHGRRLSPSGREWLAALAGLLRRLRGQTYLPVADLVGEAERALGLDIEVAARPGRAVAAARAQLEERGFEVPVAEMDPTAVHREQLHRGGIHLGDRDHLPDLDLAGAPDLA